MLQISSEKQRLVKNVLLQPSFTRVSVEPLKGVLTHHYQPKINLYP